ncbi:MAG: sulfide/dihydroorotate dehydrogenase-like FAD/NAD-binding protein [Syntrophales bacterium]
MSSIVSKENLSDSVVRMDILAPEIARKRKAGQFVILKVNEQGERIPLTIVESDGEKGTITIIFQIVGKTTALMAALNAGDDIQDVQGPLGNPTEIENFGHVVCIGGGVGVGVIYPITKALKEAGNRVTSIIGARTRSLIILEEEMRAASNELTVTTDDGSYGVHGFVSNVLQKIIDGGEKIDHVYAIGPVPMMKAIANLTRPYGIKTIVSLNAIMVDATGMCGACRVAVGGKTKFTCVDGPEFDGHQVDFDLLTNRLRMYCEQEGQSYEQHRCGWQGN